MRKPAMHAAALCVLKRPMHAEMRILVSPWRWGEAQRHNIGDAQCVDRLASRSTFLQPNMMSLTVGYCFNVGTPFNKKSGIS